MLGLRSVGLVEEPLALGLGLGLGLGVGVEGPVKLDWETLGEGGGRSTMYHI